MNFGQILTTFGPFIGGVPEKAKNINMNMIINISLMLDFQADFFCQLQIESNSITYVKSEEKKNAEMKITNVKFG